MCKQNWPGQIYCLVIVTDSFDFGRNRTWNRIRWLIAFHIYQLPTGNKFKRLHVWIQEALSVAANPTMYARMIICKNRLMTATRTLSIFTDLLLEYENIP